MCQNSTANNAGIVMAESSVLMKMTCEENRSSFP